MKPEFESTQPSHSLQAEQSILGAILQDNDALDRISTKEEELFVHKHRTLFGLIGKLIRAGKPVDVITLFEALQAAGKSENGDLQYLNSLQANTPSSANIGRYAEIVRSHADRRAMLKVLADAQDALTNGSDLTTAIDEAQAAMMALTEVRNVRAPRLIGDVLTDYVDQIDERFHGNEGPRGILTGFTRLDNVLNGLRPGELNILASRPAMGKTAFSLQIAHNAAKAGGTVLIFSMEMEDVELGERALALAGGVPYGNIVSGRMSEDDWPRLTDSICQLNDARILIDDSPALALREMRSKAMAVKRKHGLALVIVDYLQLMRGAGENRTQEVGAISRGLKALAKELKVAFLVLSQLSRKCEERPDKRPLLSDLRDSGDIEQDADCVMLLFRPVEYDSSFEPAELMEVIVAKKRNGQKGSVPLSFQGAYMRVRDYDGQWPLPQISSRMRNKPSIYPGGLE